VTWDLSPPAHRDGYEDDWGVVSVAVLSDLELTEGDTHMWAAWDETAEEESTQVLVMMGDEVHKGVDIQGTPPEGDKLQMVPAPVMHSALDVTIEGNAQPVSVAAGGVYMEEFSVDEMLESLRNGDFTPSHLDNYEDAPLLGEFHSPWAEQPMGTQLPEGGEKLRLAEAAMLTLNLLSRKLYRDPAFDCSFGGSKTVLTLLHEALNAEGHTPGQGNQGLEATVETAIARTCRTWEIDGGEEEVKSFMRELLKEWGSAKGPYPNLLAEAIKREEEQEDQWAEAAVLSYDEAETCRVRPAAETLFHEAVQELRAVTQCAWRTAALETAMAGMKHAESYAGVLEMDEPEPASQSQVHGRIQASFLKALGQLSTKVGHVHPSDAVKALTSGLDESMVWDEDQRATWNHLQRGMINSGAGSGGGSSAAASFPSWSDLGRDPCLGPENPNFERTETPVPAHAFVTPREEFVVSAGVRADKANIAARVAVPLSFDAPSANVDSPIPDPTPLINQAGQPAKRQLPAGSTVQIDLKEALRLFELRPEDMHLLQGVKSGTLQLPLSSGWNIEDQLPSPTATTGVRIEPSGTQGSPIPFPTLTWEDKRGDDPVVGIGVGCNEEDRLPISPYSALPGILYTPSVVDREEQPMLVVDETPHDELDSQVAATASQEFVVEGRRESPIFIHPSTSRITPAQQATLKARKATVFHFLNKSPAEGVSVVYKGKVVCWKYRVMKDDGANVKLWTRRFAEALGVRVVPTNTTIHTSVAGQQGVIGMVDVPPDEPLEVVLCLGTPWELRIRVAQPGDPVYVTEDNNLFDAVFDQSLAAASGGFVDPMHGKFIYRPHMLTTGLVKVQVHMPGSMYLAATDQPSPTCSAAVVDGGQAADEKLDGGQEADAKLVAEGQSAHTGGPSRSAATKATQSWADEMDEVEAYPMLAEGPAPGVGAFKLGESPAKSPFQVLQQVVQNNWTTGILMCPPSDYEWVTHVGGALRGGDQDVRQCIEALQDTWRSSLRTKIVEDVAMPAMFPLVLPAALSLEAKEAIRELLASLDAGGCQRAAAIHMLRTLVALLLRVTTNMADEATMFDTGVRPADRFWGATPAFVPHPPTPHDSTGPLWGCTSNPFAALPVDADLDLDLDLDPDLVLPPGELDAGSSLGGGKPRARPPHKHKRRKRGPARPTRTTHMAQHAAKPEVEEPRPPKPTVWRMISLLPARRAGRRRVGGVRKYHRKMKYRWLLPAHLIFVWALTVMLECVDEPTTSEMHDDEPTTSEAINEWLALKAPVLLLPIWDVKWTARDIRMLG
jgi:hypothetical protein